MQIKQDNVFIPINITIESSEEAHAIFEAIEFALCNSKYNCTQFERDTGRSIVNTLRKFINPL